MDMGRVLRREFVLAVHRVEPLERAAIERMATDRPLACYEDPAERERDLARLFGLAGSDGAFAATAAPGANTQPDCDNGARPHR